jgi:nucleotide-binding universal stress UspA family protein
MRLVRSLGPISREIGGRTVAPHAGGLAPAAVLRRLRGGRGGDRRGRGPRPARVARDRPLRPRSGAGRDPGRHRGGGGPAYVEQGDEARAQQVAAAGAERAQRLGLAAEPHVEPSAGAIWETIVALTGPETDLIVMGTRALSGLREVLLGSVAHHVVQHVQRPVLIVPAARSAASAG